MSSRLGRSWHTEYSALTGLPQGGRRGASSGTGGIPLQPFPARKAKRLVALVTTTGHMSLDPELQSHEPTTLRPEEYWRHPSGSFEKWPRDVAQLVKHLAGKHEDLSLSTQHPDKSQAWHICIPSTAVAKTGRCLELTG